MKDYLPHGLQGLAEFAGFVSVPTNRTSSPIDSLTLEPTTSPTPLGGEGVRYLLRENVLPGKGTRPFFGSGVLIGVSSVSNYVQRIGVFRMRMGYQRLELGLLSCGVRILCFALTLVLGQAGNASSVTGHQVTLKDRFGGSIPALIQESSYVDPEGGLNTRITADFDIPEDMKRLPHVEAYISGLSKVYLFYPAELEISGIKAEVRTRDGWETGIHISDHEQAQLTLSLIRKTMEQVGKRSSKLMTGSSTGYEKAKDLFVRYVLEPSEENEQQALREIANDLPSADEADYQIVDLGLFIPERFLNTTSGMYYQVSFVGASDHPSFFFYRCFPTVDPVTSNHSDEYRAKVEWLGSPWTVSNRAQSESQPYVWDDGEVATREVLGNLNILSNEFQIRDNRPERYISPYLLSSEFVEIDDSDRTALPIEYLRYGEDYRAVGESAGLDPKFRAFNVLSYMSLGDLSNLGRVRIARGSLSLERFDLSGGASAVTPMETRTSLALIEGVNEEWCALVIVSAIKYRDKWRLFGISKVRPESVLAVPNGEDDVIALFDSNAVLNDGSHANDAIALYSSIHHDAQDIMSKTYISNRKALRLNIDRTKRSLERHRFRGMRCVYGLLEREEQRTSYNSMTTFISGLIMESIFVDLFSTGEVSEHEYRKRLEDLDDLWETGYYFKNRDYSCVPIVPTEEPIPASRVDGRAIILAARVANEATGKRKCLLAIRSASGNVRFDLQDVAEDEVRLIAKRQGGMHIREFDNMPERMMELIVLEDEYRRLLDQLRSLIDD